MKLKSTVRKKGKSEIKKIRREGNIPAVVYSQGQAGKEIEISGSEFRKYLNSIEPGTLSSKIFTIESNSSKNQVIVKDIQYNITTYDIIHLDFVELEDNTYVKLNIPIKLKNAVNCVGVKLGGVLRTVIRHLKVRCLPKDIPPYFEIDVQNLNLGQSLKLSEIDFGDKVSPIGDLNQAAVVVARK